MSKIKPRFTSNPSFSTFLDGVVQQLFPEHRERQAGTGLTENSGGFEPTEVTETEVKITAKKIAIKKAPGLDGVPGLAIKISGLNVSEIFNDTFNVYLSAVIFPDFFFHSERYRG